MTVGTQPYEFSSVVFVSGTPWLKISTLSLIPRTKLGAEMCISCCHFHQVVLHQLHSASELNLNDAALCCNWLVIFLSVSYARQVTALCDVLFCQACTCSWDN